MEFKKGDFKISNDKKLLQIDRIHSFLKTTYWSPEIPKNIIEKSIENSECYGVYDTKSNLQIGFARWITDYATFAWLSDVYIEEEYRGQGLSKWLVSIMMERPEMKIIRRVALMTKDAHKLYEKFGFAATSTPQYYMEIKDSDIYLNMTK